MFLHRVHRTFTPLGVTFSSAILNFAWQALHWTIMSAAAAPSRAQRNGPSAALGIRDALYRRMSSAIRCSRRRSDLDTPGSGRDNPFGALRHRSSSSLTFGGL